MGVYHRARAELGYTPGYLLRMVSELGGLEAARELLRKSAPSDGFTTLWEKGRLDLSVESLILLPQFEHLFNSGERDRARRRLIEHGYDPEGIR